MSAAALAQHDPLCTPGSPHSLSFGVRVDAAPRLNIDGTHFFDIFPKLFFSPCPSHKLP